MRVNYILIVSLFFAAFFNVEIVKAKPQLSAEDFSKEYNLRDAEISPDGSQLASIWIKNGMRLVVIKNLDKPKSKPVIAMKDAIFRPTSLCWANDDVLLITLLVPAGTKSVILRAKMKEDFKITDYDMSRRVVALNLKTGKSVELLGNMHRFKSNRNLSVINNHLLKDPDHIIMQARIDDRYTLQKVNVNTGESQDVVKSWYRTYDIITDDDGLPLYRLDHLYHANEIEVYEYQENKDWKQIESIEIDQTYQEMIENGELTSIFLGDSNRLIYRKRNNKTGYFEFVERDKLTGKNKVLVSVPNKNVEQLLVYGDGSELVGYTVQDDLLRFKFFDSDMQKQNDKISAQVGEFNFVYRGQRRSKPREIIYSYGMDNPGNYYIYDNKTEKLKHLSQENFNLPTNKLAIPAQTQVTMRDGIKIRAYVLFPPDFEQNKVMPMVVLPHGGPHMRDSADWDLLAQFIATRGYIVVKPNFRGSSGYGKAFEEDGYQQWGGLMQDDITDTVTEMVKQGYAKKDKICIVGGSYGGYAALMATVKTPELFQCAVSMNGVTDLIDMIDYDLGEAGRYQEIIEPLLFKRLGEPSKDRKRLIANSPAMQASKISTPILIMAGEDDEIVPIEQAEKMRRALKKANNTFEYIEFEDAKHNILYDYDDRLVALTKLEEFLAKYLH